MHAADEDGRANAFPNLRLACLPAVFPMPDRSKQYEAAHSAGFDNRNWQPDEESNANPQPKSLPGTNTGTGTGVDASYKTEPIIYEESFKA